MARRFNHRAPQPAKKAEFGMWVSPVTGDVSYGIGAWGEFQVPAGTAPADALGIALAQRNVIRSTPEEHDEMTGIFFEETVNEIMQLAT